MSSSLPSSFFPSSWELLPARMPGPLEGFAAVGREGKVVVIGGYDHQTGQQQSSCRVFHVETRTWDTFASMAEPRCGCAAVWHDQTIYVMGGWDDDTLECLGDGVSFFLPSMATKRFCCAATLVEDVIVVVGGQESSLGVVESLRTAEQFDLERKTWSALPNMLQARTSCAACTVNKSVYVFGGYNHVRCLRGAECFGWTSRNWEPLPDMPCVRVGGVAVAVGRYILLVGGYDAVGNDLARVDCFDTEAFRWVTTVPSLHTARSACAAACLVGNQVLVMAGDTMERITIHPHHIQVPRLRPLMKSKDLPLSLWPHMIANRAPSVIFFILCSDRFKLDSVLLQQNKIN